MPEGTQRYERTKMVLPLRVWTDEHASDAAAQQLAHTIDISPIGGRLGGLRSELLPGQTITLQRGQHKAAFRVVWSKHLSHYENQAGIEVVEEGRNIWGVDLPYTFPAPHSTDQIGNSKALVPEVRISVPRSSVPARRASRSLIPHVIPRRALWGLSLGLFLLSAALSLSLYREIFTDTDRAAIKVPVPGPPTAAELARMTPKPRVILAPVTVPTGPLVQVAEAPTGRIVYPVSPDESLAGKVSLQIVVAANGIVKQIHVLSGRQVLAQAAEQAVRFWHYRPFQTDGPPTERETTVVVSFRGQDAVSLQFPTANSKSQISSN